MSALSNPWRAECSGSARRRVWKWSGLCRALNATVQTCDNLMWLPCAMHASVHRSAQSIVACTRTRGNCVHRSPRRRYDGDFLSTFTVGNPYMREAFILNFQIYPRSDLSHSNERLVWAVQAVQEYFPVRFFKFCFCKNK